MFKNLKIKDKSNLEINLSKAFSKDDLIEMILDVAAEDEEEDEAPF